MQALVCAWVCVACKCAFTYGLIIPFHNEKCVLKQIQFVLKKPYQICEVLRMPDALPQAFNRLQMHMVNGIPVIQPDIAGVLLL